MTKRLIFSTCALEQDGIFEVLCEQIVEVNANKICSVIDSTTLTFALDHSLLLRILFGFCNKILFLITSFYLKLFHSRF